jgi:tetratricopeptide (TPR) repeat protein
MKHFTIRTAVLVLLGLCLLLPGWSQGKGEQGEGGGDKAQAQPGTPAVPQASKKEVTAYNKFVADQKTADARQRINEGTAFLASYPDSIYAGAVYGTLAPAYLQVNDVPKLIDAGTKALVADPNNVDILPLMAWAIPRAVSASTPNAVQQLEMAVNYGKRGIDLLSTMPKPAEIDDATFAKLKNDKLAQCRSGIGTAYFKTGKYDDAVTELSQAVRLDSSPDPVDYYVLGVANQRTSHFTDAIAAFDKCAASPGQLQTNCKNLSAETKKTAANSLEAH